MDERQRYALTNPVTDPSDVRQVAAVQDQLRQVRRHARGFLLQSILAVDR